MIRTKSGAAALSIASNAMLIAIKLAAGAITGSIAILTEAVHSLIDLIASVVAFVSVRKADEPADADHPYGHEKVESLAATIEGMLILVGAGIIVYEATQRLVDRRRGRGARDRHRRDGLLGASPTWSSPRCSRGRPRARIAGARGRRRAPAHRRAHLGRGARRAALVEITGVVAFDSITALLVAAAIVVAGLRILRRSSGVLVDEALPERRWTGSRRRSPPPAPPEVAGYHKLRARRAGSRRYIDLHVQYRSGTSLERAHELAHAMRDAIEAEIRRAEVLIHVEPETSFRDPDGDGPLPLR